MAKKPTLILFTVCLVLITVHLRDLKRESYPAGEAAIGGEFSLVDPQGARVSSEQMKGRLMVVYMGYAQCPDICPAALSMMGEVIKNLGADADKVAFVFITLDPANDTPAALKKYLEAFNPRIIGLTGSEAEIKSVMRSYKVYADPTDNPGPGNMLITHSGLMYLMDAQGKYVHHFESGAKADTVLEAIKGQL